MSTAGILTVGDELLAGDVENTNATWLAAQLTERGVDVREIRTVPDEVDPIAAAVRTFAESFDYVIVTGGLGSTPDDVTIEAVSRALDQPLTRNEDAWTAIDATVSEIEADFPEFDFDRDAASLFPADGEMIPNDEGIAPGCVVDHIYILPGIPPEMRSVFDEVASAFTGEMHSRSVISSIPESNLNPLLAELRQKFDLRVGCYPDEAGEQKQIKISGTDRERVERAHAWLQRRQETDT